MARTSTHGDLVAIIVGAGAVKNSWAPVLRALEPFAGCRVSSDGANSFLARLVYLLRWYSSIPGKENELELKRFQAYFADVKRAVCSEIRKSEEEGELEIRPEFFDVIDNLFIPRARGLMFVTTNWDSVVDKALKAHLNKHFRGELYPLHIHGSVAKHETLYLPTEVTRERYRTHAEDQEMGGIHTSIMDGLGRVRWAVLYGLSLSPLDAELCQTLSSGWDGPLEQIDVVVPDHEQVAHRVNLLLDPQRRIKTVGYHPLRLHKPIDYSRKVPPPDA